MKSYIIFVLISSFLIGNLRCAEKDTSAYIVPTSEENYRRLYNVANGIDSIRGSRIKFKSEGLEAINKAEDLENKEITDSEGGKIESPKSPIKEIVQLEEKVEKEEQKVPKEHEEPQESKSMEKNEQEPVLDVNATGDTKMFNTTHLKVQFSFRPFAETARAVGIPAYSAQNSIVVDLSSTLNGILDSKTLIELYYFDYDNKIIRTALDEENAWISRSLLTLIHRSEQEDPLSLLLLGYGVTTAHWESFVPEEDLDAPEILIENTPKENEQGLGDIVFGE
ncbi:hypothetical protein HWI79_1637 [Cryptosporidium felis]|nr:hypothetical protein HWI79_1637 [Cryptosporidium felis]